MSKKGKKADSSEGLDISIGQYLEKEGYSDAFRDDYLVVCTLISPDSPREIV